MTCRRRRRGVADSHLADHEKIGIERLDGVTRGCHHVIETFSGNCGGGSDVTTTSGFTMDSGEKLTLQNKNNPIYGVTNTGTTVVQVLVVGT